MRDERPAIITEDGVTVHRGDRVYNYYSCWWGFIRTDPDSEGWFDVERDSEDFHRTVRLNGRRISSYRPPWAAEAEAPPRCPDCGTPLHFRAFFASPSFGESWECENGHGYAKIGGTFYDPREQAHVLSPEDVR